MKWSHDRNVSGSKFNLVWPFMCSVKVKKDNIRIRMVTAIVWYNNKINDLLSVEIFSYYIITGSNNNWLQPVCKACISKDFI
jgi:hypothetical protein